MGEWKVLFDQNYWGSHEIDVAALEKDQQDNFSVCTEERRINQIVEWYGETWKLLSFYVCSKGLVLDYCKKIDPEELQAFTDRFQTAGFDENHFDEELFERLQMDNPTAPHVHVELVRNGKELSSQGSSSISYVPGCVENQENDPIALLCMEHYGLDARYAWHFSRAHFLWDGGRAGDLSDLAAVFDEMEVTVPGEHFHLTGERQRISLTHAVSGAHFDLCIEDIEAGELEQETLKMMGEKMIYPTHYEAVSYHTEPVVPEDSYFLKARAQGDSPVSKENSKKAAASVSIIGGSSGPTSIFLAGNRSDNALHSRSVCSPLFFEPTPVREWYICYRLKRREPLQVPLNVSEV